MPLKPTPALTLWKAQAQKAEKNEWPVRASPSKTTMRLTTKSGSWNQTLPSFSPVHWTWRLFCDTQQPHVQRLPQWLDANPTPWLSPNLPLPCRHLSPTQTPTSFVKLRTHHHLQQGGTLGRKAGATPPLNPSIKDYTQLVQKIKALAFGPSANLDTSNSGTFPGTNALDAPFNWPNYVLLWAY